METQQKVRSKRTTTKKSATAKKQKGSNGTLTTQQIKDRTICDGNVVLFQRENSKRCLTSAPMEQVSGIA